MDREKSNNIIQQIAKECNSHEKCKDCSFHLEPFEDEEGGCIFDEIVMPKQLENYEL